MTPRNRKPRLFFIGYACLALGSIAALAGCNSSATPVAPDHDHDHDHDHGHRPASLEAAVEEVLACRDVIRSAMEKDKPDDAHDPLHEVGELLELLPDLAAETDLPKEEWEALKAATDRLMDAFGQIDKAFHQKDGDRQGAYEKSAAEVDAAIQEIKANVPVDADAEAPAPHAAAGEAS